MSNGKPGAVDFNSLYLQSEEYRQLKAAIDPMLEGVQQKEKASGIAGHFKNRKQNSINYATSFFWQVGAILLFHPRTRIQASFPGLKHDNME